MCTCDCACTSVDMCAGGHVMTNSCHVFHCHYVVNVFHEVNRL